MRLMTKIILFLSLVMIIFAIPSVAFLWNNYRKTVQEQAHIRAQAIYQMIVITRQWVADNRDMVDPVPAVVTKELSEYAKYMATFRFHITSSRLVNPDNAPNEFEKRALAAMENEHVKEYVDMYYDGNTNYYRYAAPLYINEACLSCHDWQDYRLNDVRGLISITFPLSDMEKSIASNNRITFYIVIIGLFLILILISFSLYYMVTRHLTTLQKAAESMRLGEHMETNIKTNDEIQELSEAFDQMSAQIADNEEILKYNLQEAVSKYIELVNELELKNEKLDSLNKLKSDLLDSIAHEIRTPLTKILSYSELLQDPRVMEQETVRDKFTASMKHNVNVIKNMFNDIITLSRLEHDQHIYHKIPIQSGILIKDLLENMDMEIGEKNLEIVMDMEDCVLYVDGETFSIAMSNILSNAIKYSKTNGKIEISGSKENARYVITVKDYGIGIDEKDLGKLFDRFYRGDNAKKEFSGTGLGLSIVGRIIRDHNGTITIDSEIDKWTRIKVYMPLFEDE